MSDEPRDANDAEAIETRGIGTPPDKTYGRGISTEAEPATPDGNVSVIEKLKRAPIGNEVAPEEDDDATPLPDTTPGKPE